MIENKAIYIGKVSKWGSRVIPKNGRDVLEFDIYLPSQKQKPNGFREMFSVRVSIWGTDGKIERKVSKGELIMVKGIPENNGKANALMAFERDMAIGEEEIKQRLSYWGEGNL